MRARRSIELFSSDTAAYRDNLADGTPRIWVALRRQDGGDELELTKVTADPTEGEAMFESGCDVIGTVPMPPDIAAWVAAFVDQVPCRARVPQAQARPGGRRARLSARTMEAADEWPGAGRRQGFSGALVAAQAGGEATRAEAGAACRRA